jgi:hypothetical protein
VFHAYPIMFDDENTTSFWDTASNAVGDAWSGVSGAASDAWSGASGAATDAWNGVSGAASGAAETVSGWFGGGAQDEGPISVPVTPEQEAAAAAQVAEADRLNADPNYRNPYEQRQDEQAERQRAYEKRQADKAAADPANMWNAELDKFLKGEGPNPGGRTEYVQRVQRQRDDATASGLYGGQY